MPFHDPSANPMALLTRRLHVRRAELAALQRAIDTATPQTRWRMRALEDEIVVIEEDLAFRRSEAA